jgi:hypothetical protein
MTLAIAQDRILKVLSDSGLAGLMGEGEAASGDGFLDVMDELAGDDRKQGETAASEGQASDGQKTGLPPLVALDAALASASIAGAMQANAQVATATAADAQSNAAKAVSDLAQLLVKSANDAQGAAVSLQSGTDGADMSEAGVTLEAWSQGPSSAAAMTTGAQDKRPMQMAVVDVATHFAPVEMVSEADVVAGQTAVTTQVPADTSDTGEQRTSTTPDAGPVSVAAIAQAAAGAGSNANSGMNDRSSGDPRDDRDRTADVALDATAHADAIADAAETIGQHSSPARQVAAEVTKEIPKLAAAMPAYDPADVKAPLSKLQVLKIQLQPDHLGSVNVRTQLRADVVELHIETSRAETAELLRRDREVLSSLMRAAGYAADDAQIKVTHAEPAMAASLIAATDPASNSSATSQNSSQQGGSQAQANSQSSSHDRPAGSQDRDEHSRRPGQNQSPDQLGESARPGTRSPGSSGIYL